MTNDSPEVEFIPEQPHKIHTLHSIPHKEKKEEKRQRLKVQQLDKTKMRMKTILLIFTAILIAANIPPPPTETSIHIRNPFIEDPVIMKAREWCSRSGVDWKETSHSHVYKLDVPGVRSEDMKIEVKENGIVVIKGERKREELKEGERWWHRADRKDGKFCRKFMMPLDVDLESVEAHLDDGVLTITVVKVSKVKKHPKLVQIGVPKSVLKDIRALKY